MTARERVTQLIKIFPKVYPDAHTELDFRNPLQLLVATILSAQCTDKRVNMVTPFLFKKYRTAKDYANASQAEFEAAIKSTGFFRSKTKSIRGAMRAIAEEHGGKVPDTMEELNALPGVGRKTANVVLGNAFHKNEGIVVDTHVIRLSQRLGLTKHKDPEKIERALDRLESLAHLARPPPLLCAKTGLQPVRGFQVMSQRQSFPANRPGTGAGRRLTACLCIRFAPSAAVSTD
jgi:endonuclease-3